MSPRRNTKGEGTAAYLTSDGRWRAEVVTGWADDGRRLTKVLYGGTEAEANRKLRRALNERDDGTLVAGRSPTLGEWLHYWLTTIAPAKQLKPRTLGGYGSYIRTWITGTRTAQIPLDKLKVEDLEAVYKRMRDAGRSETTVLQLHRILSRALKVAVQRGRLGVNPATRMDSPKAASFDPGVLTPEDAKRLIRLADTMEGGARWMVGLALGPRQGEILGMGWDQVDLDAGRVKINRELYRLPWHHGCVPEGGDPTCGRAQFFCPKKHGGGLFIGTPKSDAGRRDVPLPSQLVDALAKHKDRQRTVRVQEGVTGPWVSANGHTVDLVFSQRSGRPINSQDDWEAWKAFLKSAGVPPVRVHDARHTAATVLLLMGVDGRVVMDMMGWSSMSMLKRYQHVLDELKQSAADAVGTALWSKPVEPAPPAAGGSVSSLDEFRKRKQA